MWPHGIRGRLVVAITVVAAATLAISFFVVHQRTGSDLESRIDEQLAGDLQEFESSPAASARTEGQLVRRSRAFVNGQAYHPDSRIFAIEIGNGPKVVTNSEELIESELGESEGGGRRERPPEPDRSALGRRRIRDAQCRRRRAGPGADPAGGRRRTPARHVSTWPSR